MARRRWDPCVSHQGGKAEIFVRDFLGDKSRSVLLVAGAGFDPRTRRIPNLMDETRQSNFDLLLLRERRPDPNPRLLGLAEANIAELNRLGARIEMSDISVFADDGAVVGAREAARSLARVDYGKFTDIVVDASAFSVGIVFPIVRFLCEVLANRADGAPNLHLLIVDAPRLDYSVHSTAADQATFVGGFRGGLGLSKHNKSTRLWLPNLRENRKAVLERVLEFVRPDAVSPILPFPSEDVRRADRLLEEYSAELQSIWLVDPRQIIFAHESDPLDLYRTILRIHDIRSRVFEHVGGSHIVLTPLASKLSNMGAMMAAIEHDFPVVYVETIRYDLEGNPPTSVAENSEITHIWLSGEAYG